MKKSDQILQFKITLNGTKPPVWRRIQVPANYSLWDLHVAIQDAMGWHDCHLHDFEFKDPSSGRIVRIGIPEQDGIAGSETLTGWNEKIAKWFPAAGYRANYTYDFGDDWRHRVQLEKILPSALGAVYLICLAGRLACPPEDCGGVWGYRAISSENNSWQGHYSGFNPSAFSPKEVSFTDPAARLKMRLS